MNDKDFVEAEYFNEETMCWEKYGERGQALKNIANFVGKGIKSSLFIIVPGFLFMISPAIALAAVQNKEVINGVIENSTKIIEVPIIDNSTLITNSSNTGIVTVNFNWNQLFYKVLGLVIMRLLIPEPNSQLNSVVALPLSSALSFKTLQEDIFISVKKVAFFTIFSLAVNKGFDIFREIFFAKEVKPLILDMDQQPLVVGKSSLLEIKGGFFPFKNELLMAGNLFNYLRGQRENRKNEKMDNNDYSDLFAGFSETFQKDKKRSGNYLKYLLGLPLGPLLVAVYLFRNKLFKAETKHGEIFLSGTTVNTLGIKTNYSTSQRVVALIKLIRKYPILTASLFFSFYYRKVIYTIVTNKEERNNLASYAFATINNSQDFLTGQLNLYSNKVIGMLQTLQSSLQVASDQDRENLSKCLTNDKEISVNFAKLNERYKSLGADHTILLQTSKDVELLVGWARGISIPSDYPKMPELPTSSPSQDLNLQIQKAQEIAAEGFKMLPMGESKKEDWFSWGKNK